MFNNSTDLEATKRKAAAIKSGIIHILGESKKPIKHRIIRCYAYAVLIASTFNNPFGVPLNEVFSVADEFNPSISKYLKSVMDEKVFHSIMNDLFEPTAEGIDAFHYLLSNKMSTPYEDPGNSFTPASLSDLAIRILDIKPDEKVADIGSGDGDFIFRAADACQDSKFEGCEISTDSYLTSLLISHIRQLSGKPSNVSFINIDAFELEERMYQAEGVRYDKVFSNFPFGVRMALSGMGEKFISKYKGRLPKYGPSGDSVFSLLVERLVSWSPSAKGIAVVPNGFTWNASDLPTRRSMIEHGMIEAVIALPERLFESFSIPVALVVFSYAHEKIRMVDATQVFSRGRRQNYLSEENIERIVCSLTQDSEISRMVSYDELSGNEFTLNPVRYFSNEVTFENGIRLGDLLSTGVIRGAQLSADKLDELISHKETKYQYLMLSNIQNGMITDDLPYLKNIDESLKKYCLKDNDLILSKNGYPFKVAIVHPDEGKTILANGNLFIVRTDQSKLNPIYLKAFLESEKGTDILKRIAVGSTIPNISQKSLESITIPVPPVEEQNEIAEKYTSVQDEILILQNRLAKAISKLKEIL